MDASLIQLLTDLFATFVDVTDTIFLLKERPII